MQELTPEQGLETLKRYPWSHVRMGHTVDLLLADEGAIFHKDLAVKVLDCVGDDPDFLRYCAENWTLQAITILLATNELNGPVKVPDSPEKMRAFVEQTQHRDEGAKP